MPGVLRLHTSLQGIQINQMPLAITSPEVADILPAEVIAPGCTQIGPQFIEGRQGGMQIDSLASIRVDSVVAIDK